MAEIDHDEVLGESIVLGDEAEKFLSTQLGKYMLGRVLHLRDEAMLELRTVEPENIKQIRKLQADIRQAENFPAWIQEVIHEGERSYEELVRENETQE